MVIFKLILSIPFFIGDLVFEVCQKTQKVEIEKRVHFQSGDRYLIIGLIDRRDFEDVSNLRD